jgi:uncharacterized membrane protein
MKIKTQISIILGILWSLAIINYVLESKTSFVVFMLVSCATGFVLGSDLVFYYWAKEKNDENDNKMRKLRRIDD